MKLTTLAARVFGVDAGTLSDDSTNRTTPNWDSARHIELLLTIEVAYEVQFSMAEISRMYSLGDMRAVLAEKGAVPLAA